MNRVRPRPSMAFTRPLLHQWRRVCAIHRNEDELAETAACRTQEIAARAQSAVRRPAARDAREPETTRGKKNRISMECGFIRDDKALSSALHRAEPLSARTRGAPIPVYLVRHFLHPSTRGVSNDDAFKKVACEAGWSARYKLRRFFSFFKIACEIVTEHE